MRGKKTHILLSKTPDLWLWRLHSLHSSVFHLYWNSRPKKNSTQTCWCLWFEEARSRQSPCLYNNYILKVLTWYLFWRLSLIHNKQLEIKGRKYQHLQNIHSVIKNQNLKRSRLWHASWHPTDPAGDPFAMQVVVWWGLEAQAGLLHHPAGTLNKAEV